MRSRQLASLATMKPRDDSALGITATPRGETARLRIESPIGRLTLTANAVGEIVSVLIAPDGTPPQDVLGGDAIESEDIGAEQLADDELTERAMAALHRAAQQLGEYFAGTRTAFTVTLAAPAGTAFQRAVWQRIADIPYGAGATYGQIALDIGKPGAGRAVGSAVAANTQPLFVGCHRVLGVSGHITGYSQGAGTPTKQWLLRHEGTPHRPGVQQQDQPRLLATISSTTSSSSPAAP